MKRCLIWRNLEDGTAKELSPKDILENIVVKIADDVEVDVSIHAWKITYAEALGDAQKIDIDGVSIPFLGIGSLIASKETYREQDAIDRIRLLDLQRQRNKS